MRDFTTKKFTNEMQIEEIRGQRILTSVKKIDNDWSSSELYLKNIPSDAFEDELVPFLEIFGPIQTLRIMVNEKRNFNKGYAYFNYLNKNDSNNAFKFLSLIDFRKNCRLIVEPSANNCRIFIGNIPINKTKDEIWRELTNQGLKWIVDVIMYRAYNNRAQNRGFVFVEFPSHKHAAKMRCKHKNLRMWGNKAIVDWSVPQMDVPEEVMSQVKIVYLRNLWIHLTRNELRSIIEEFVDPSNVEKIYKFKNYAFIHLSTRPLAEKLKLALEYYYKNSEVEVEFAKPPSPYTRPEYRKSQLTKHSACNEIKHSNTLSQLATSLNDIHLDHSANKTYTQFGKSLELNEFVGQPITQDLCCPSLLDKMLDFTPNTDLRLEYTNNFLIDKMQHLELSPKQFAPTSGYFASNHTDNKQRVDSSSRRNLTFSSGYESFPSSLEDNYLPANNFSSSFIPKYSSVGSPDPVFDMFLPLSTSSPVRTKQENPVGALDRTISQTSWLEDVDIDLSSVYNYNQMILEAFF